MTGRQRIAFTHPCYHADECRHPRFAWYVHGTVTASVILTLTGVGEESEEYEEEGRLAVHLRRVCTAEEIAVLIKTHRYRADLSLNF